MNANHLAPVLILILCLVYIEAGEYTLTAPNKFRAGSSYRFAVTVYGKSNIEYQLDAKIENPWTGKILVQKHFDVNQPDRSHQFELLIPNIVQEDQFNFVVEATGDINFNGTHDVQAITKTHSLFIQTDKSIYKPGQKVLFRVIVLDPELKPYNKSISITIYDKSENRIYQKENQTNSTGVITGELQLSDITPLGQWKIEVKSETLKKEVYFQVAGYVLPKFEVKVLLPSYFLINKLNPSAQNSLHFTVIATYTFGKPVKGFALVGISLKYLWANLYDVKSTNPLITKNVELVDGKADISLTLSELNVLSNGGLSSGSYNIFVQSNVTEAVTGIILQGNNTIPIESQKYKLKFLSISSDNFKPGLSYKTFAQLSQADDSEPLLDDIKNPDGSFKSLVVRVVSYTPIPTTTSSPDASNYSTTTPWWFQLYIPTQASEQYLSVEVAANGYIVFEIPTEVYWKSVNIEILFYDEETQSNVTTNKYLEPLGVRDKKYVQLSLPNKSEAVKPQSNIILNVQTNELITSFNYQVLGKGGILLSDSYSLPNAFNNINFTIFISENMALNVAPTATIVVYYITSTGELVADSLALSVTDYFANKVSITFDRESTSPGEEVILRLNASENSHAYLLAVDQSVLLLSAGNDITQNMVVNEINGYSGGESYFNDNFMFRMFCWPMWLGGQDTVQILNNAGIFVMTNYHISSSVDAEDFYMERSHFFDSNPIMYDSPVPPLSHSTEEISTRTNFPETWIWSDAKLRSDGFLEMKYKVPDSITSWIAYAFATNSKSGLGIADESAKVTVIKPFFITPNFPYSIIRGEQFASQVTVFNYYGLDLKVDVTLAKSNYFKVLKCTDGNELPSINDNATKSVQVANNDMVTVYFWIVATSLGTIPIEVKAVAGVAGDSFIVKLLVKPEGQPQAYSTSSMIRVPQEQSPVINFGLSLPPTNILVPGSVVIEATVIGDILGSTINNLDKLLQMPHGCGEQNMVTLAPDVYIVKYLTSTNQLTEVIKNKALAFIIAGYQRELTYQRNDGSFSAFGDQDPDGSVWLSSFVTKVFRESSEFIGIDDNKIAQCLAWILQHQNSEGKFSEPPNGRVIHTDMQGGASSGIGLTAYVAISLLVNKDIQGVNNLHEKINLTISYLEAQYNTLSNDSYALSIIGYAFYLAGSSKLIHLLELLNSLSIQEDGMKYWHKATEDQIQPGTWKPPYQEAKTRDIEMTSYVLMIYSSIEDFSNSLPIAKWLLSKRNAEGGFVSTQDTVLGLEAFSMFGKLVIPPVNSEGLTVKVTGDATSEIYTFATINKESALLLQSHQLPSSTTNVTFSASGQGLALVQINVKYYINSPKEDQPLKQILTTESNNTKLDLKMCLFWLGREATGMVLTEVNLLTGFTLSSDYVDVLSKEIGSVFMKQEFNSNRLSIYLDKLTNKEICFTVKMVKTFFVNLVKPALAKTYLYYSPDVMASGFYSQTSTSETENVCDSMFN